MPILTIETPSGDKRRITLDAASATLGGGERNRLQIDSLELDGVQVRFDLRLMIHDLTERDGILVAGRRVPEVTIGSGDSVALGRAGAMRLQFDCENGESPKTLADVEVAALRRRLEDVLSTGARDRDDLRRAIDEAQLRFRRAETAREQLAEQLAASDERYEQLLQALRDAEMSRPAPAPTPSRHVPAPQNGNGGTAAATAAELEHLRSQAQAAQRVFELEIEDLRRRNRELAARLLAAEAAPRPVEVVASIGLPSADPETAEALRRAKSRIDAMAAETLELRAQLDQRRREGEDHAAALARQLRIEEALRSELDGSKERRREAEREFAAQIDELNELRRRAAGLDWTERARAMEQQAERLKAEIVALQAELERTKAESATWRLKAEQLEASGIVRAGGPGPSRAGDHQWMMQLLELPAEQLLAEDRASPIVCVAAAACQTLLAIESGNDKLRAYVVSRWDRAFPRDKDNVAAVLEDLAKGVAGARKRWLDYVGGRMRNQVSLVTLSLYYHIAEELFEQHLRDIRPMRIQSEAKVQANQKAQCWDHFVKKMETINALTFKEQLEDELNAAFRAHLKPGSKQK